jgi:hypothetical protein
MQFQVSGTMGCPEIGSRRAGHLPSTHWARPFNFCRMLPVIRPQINAWPCGPRTNGSRQMAMVGPHTPLTCWAVRRTSPNPVCPSRIISTVVSTSTKMESSSSLSLKFCDEGIGLPYSSQVTLSAHGGMRRSRAISPQRVGSSCRGINHGQVHRAGSCISHTTTTRLSRAAFAEGWPSPRLPRCHRLDGPSRIR